MWNTRQERGRDDRALRLESWQQIMQDQRRRLLPPSPSTNVAPATEPVKKLAVNARANRWRCPEVAEW